MICEIKGIPIYYEQYGEGTLILCIHGHMIDHRFMTGCIEPVYCSIDGYKRIYLDLPGMGKTPSGWIKNADDMLALIIEFIDAVLPDENFLIAGSSYGGYMALGLIRAIKNRIDGVLLIASGIYLEETNRKIPVPERQILLKDKMFEDMKDDDTVNDFLDVAVIATPQTYERFKTDCMPGIKLADNDFLSWYDKEGYCFSFEDELRTLVFDKPSCILTGRQDHWIGYKDAFELIDRFPRATFAILDCAGHNLQFERQELFEMHVKDWLWRVEV